MTTVREIALKTYEITSERPKNALKSIQVQKVHKKTIKITILNSAMASVCTEFRTYLESYVLNTKQKKICQIL